MRRRSGRVGRTRRGIAHFPGRCLVKRNLNRFNRAARRGRITAESSLVAANLCSAFSATSGQSRAQWMVRYCLNRVNGTRCETIAGNCPMLCTDCALDRTTPISSSAPICGRRGGSFSFPREVPSRARNRLCRRRFVRRPLWRCRSAHLLHYRFSLVVSSPAHRSAVSIVDTPQALS